MNQPTLMSILNSLDSHLTRFETHTKTFHALKMKLSYPPDHMHIIGNGDDGLVFKVFNSEREDTPIAIKTIRKLNGHPSLNEIARDQAYREFKALKLIKNHPNFLKLYSNELDDCCVYDNPPYDAWAIRMSYEPNLWNIVEISRFFGLQALTIDLLSHSSLVKYINYQMFDVLLHLERLNIRHRDLESVNVKVQMPAMRLVVFDFARADLPNENGLEPTQCPNDIIAEAYDEMTKSKGTDMQRASLEHYKEVRAAYKVPMTTSSLSILITKENEYTDFTMMEILATRQNRIWINDVRDLLNSHSLGFLHQYQCLLDLFLSNIWRFSDKKQSTLQTVLDPQIYHTFLSTAIKNVEHWLSTITHSVYSKDYATLIRHEKGTYAVINFDTASDSFLFPM